MAYKLPNQMDKIIDYLYLGDIQAASNLPLLKKYVNILYSLLKGVTHIL